MALDELPPQEPLTPGGERFGREAMKRGGALTGTLVQYGEHPQQTALVFPAKRPQGPALFWYHGGNWTNGLKEWFSFMAPALNARGITFVTFDYRLAPGEHFPVGFEDCLYGFDAVYRNLPAYGGDPERVFVGGHDAGAHYAALAALKAGWRDALSLPNTCVKGCLPVSGFYDFSDSAGFTRRPIFLGPPEHKPERFASAVRYAYPQAPAFLVTYGSEDLPHAKMQGHALVKALRAENVTVEELIVQGADHYSAALSLVEDTSPWLAAACWMMGVSPMA